MSKPDYRFIGKPIRRAEDERLITGRGQFSDDFRVRRADLRRDRALALSACAHPRDRFIARAQDEGRARRVHRRRLPRRQSRADPARSAAEDPRRPEAARAGRRQGLHRTAHAAAGRQGAPCRRGGGDGGRRDQEPGARRRRGGRGRLRRAAVRHPLRGRDQARRAGGVGRAAEQHAGRDLLRRPRGDRQGVRRRRPRRQARPAYRARHRRAARAARGGRELRQADRPLHALCRFRRRGAAEARAGDGARHQAGRPARPVARRRRQFRHPQPRLRRVRAGAVGVEEGRPAGEVHRDALGSIPHRLPGPRSRHQGGAGAAQGRKIPGDARDQHQQYRLPGGVVLAAVERVGADPGLLRHPGGVAARRSQPSPIPCRRRPIVRRAGRR